MRPRAYLAEHKVRCAFILAIAIAMIAGSALGASGFTATDSGGDITTLDLDRDGADVVPTEEAQLAGIQSSRGVDTTTLYLDRDGADIPEANWWGRDDIENVAQAAETDEQTFPDVTTLNLDRDGADVVVD